MHLKLLPEFCFSQKRLQRPAGIIIHYFSATHPDLRSIEDPYSLADCYKLFVDLNRPGDQKLCLPVDRYAKRGYGSAHFLIDRNGFEWQLVPKTQIAYHAGDSVLNGRKNCNSWTFGVELIGTIDSGFTEEQYDAVARRCATLSVEFAIKDWSFIAGHDHVTQHRQFPKTDPGPLFNWGKFFGKMRWYIAGA